MIEAVGILKDNVEHLPAKDQTFAKSLLKQLEKKGDLSPKQWPWVFKMAEEAYRIKEGIPDFTKELVEIGPMDGLLNLFAHAKQHLKYPKIRLQTPLGKPLCLSVAGDKSQYPGAINCTDGGSFGSNTWYGRITQNGVFEAGKHSPDPEIVQLLQDLSKDPAGVAAKYGQKTYICCFCRATLTDERSRLVGYGPQCAQHFHLPWGGK
jgi:hypothetical protein